MGSFKSQWSKAPPLTHIALAGSNGHPRQTEITTPRTTNAAELIASRIGDAFLAYFLALGQEVGRRLRRRNSHARQARQPTQLPHPKRSENQQKTRSQRAGVIAHMRQNLNTQSSPSN
ncbi:protein of unknown function [Cupriavidus taiwanensis]|nr:protein of unknown function [Cupriavidus taiwanensis]